MLFADESADYTAVNMTATFDSSSIHNSTVMTCVNISIINDATGEPFEQFTVVVEALDPSGRITIRNGMIIIVIRDNERKYKN